MKAYQRNPVFWLMWMIPGAAVLAGTSMVAVALKSADRALPDIYHWEGERLDADFERARQAFKLGIRAELTLFETECRLTLQGSDAPELQLRLTHGSNVRQDRALTLTRQSAGLYRGDCTPLTQGRWRVALQDSANTWSLRTGVDGAPERISLWARDPDGPAS